MLGRAENRPEVGSWVTARSRGTIYGHRKELGFIVSAMETCGCFQKGESYYLCFTGPTTMDNRGAKAASGQRLTKASAFLQLEVMAPWTRL